MRKKKHLVYKENYACNPSTCVSEIDKCFKNYDYMKIRISNLLITFSGIIDTPETASINSAKKKKKLNELLYFSH